MSRIACHPKFYSRREACWGAAALLASWALMSPNAAFAAEGGRPDSAENAPVDPLDSLDSIPKLPNERFAVSFPVSIVDDLGRTVEIASLDAVVACMGSFAKLWELAGGPLVGVSDDALLDYDLANPETLQSVGQFTAPNLEQILALQPSLVICSAATSGRGGQASQLDLQQPLEEAGIPVAYFEVTVFEDYLRMLATCCGLTGRGDRYHEYGVAVANQVRTVIEVSRDAAAIQEAAGAEPPTCLLMTTYSGGVRVSTSSTQTGAMLAALGAVNLADANRSLLKDFSIESAIALNPRFIFVIPMGDDQESAQKALDHLTENDPAWAAMGAVAEGRCFMLDPTLYLYKPLNLWAQAYADLASQLWGIDISLPGLLSDGAEKPSDEQGVSNAAQKVLA